MEFSKICIISVRTYRWWLLFTFIVKGVIAMSDFEILSIMLKFIGLIIAVLALFLNKK